jgi:hypothetical protein
VSKLKTNSTDVFDIESFNKVSEMNRNVTDLKKAFGKIAFLDETYAVGFFTMAHGVINSITKHLSDFKITIIEPLKDDVLLCLGHSGEIAKL